MKIQKKDHKKYIIVDRNNMIMSCEYISTLREAKQELKEIKKHLQNLEYENFFN